MSTEGFISTLRALCGPLQSPLSMRRSPTKMPSVQVMPTHLPVPRRIWAMKRVTVVLPLTPVTATMGIRPFSPGGNRVSTIASPTGREMPTEGCKVHAQARSGVDLDDHASLLAQGARDVLGDHVDAGDVQPHDLGGVDGRGRHGRMHALGDVDGRAAGAQIGVAADQHHRARPAEPTRA